MKIKNPLKIYLIKIIYKKYQNKHKIYKQNKMKDKIMSIKKDTMENLSQIINLHYNKKRKKRNKIIQLHCWKILQKL